MLEPVRLLDRPLSAAVRSAAERAGYTELQARVIAGRLGDADAARVGTLVRPRLGDLDAPDRLPDIDVAADAVADAIVRGLPILPISDFDCDGASGHCVLKLALRDHFGVPEHRIHSFIGHRLRDGYGVSETLVDRILEQAPSPALVVTIDQGSTDHVRVSKLRERGIRTVVTDHHGVPEHGPPADALACVNPVRADSAFPDPYVAGVHVAWLLCCAVRQRLIERGHLPPNAPKLGGLLDLVALGTMADCVDLARSANNRAVLARGLELMNAPNARPVWRALYAAARCSGPITAATLGFNFGPIINARGRLDCALGSVDLLMCPREDQALALAHTLVEHNQQRKIVQAQMLRRVAGQAEEQAGAGRAALCILDLEGHPGVHGVCAARLVEAFGRPVAYFSPKADSDCVTASLRTVPGFHVRGALAEIAALYPRDVLAWGGHAGAGGITLRREGFDRFREAFAAIAQQALAKEQLGPRVLTDGPLDRAPSLELVQELAALEPFGRQWEAPVFRGRAIVRGLRAIGDGTHLKLSLEMGRQRYDSIWFGAVKEGQAPVAEGEPVEAAYELDANTYGGQTRLQLRIRHATVAAA